MIHQTLDFDYVIVGAGTSAMGLIYGLLDQFTETAPPFKIAVIEKGQATDPDPTTAYANDWYHAAHIRHSTSVTQIPVNMTGGRIIDLPLGQGLGGTSNINACLCTPPLSQDFDNWPKQWKHLLLSSIERIQLELEKNRVIHSGSMEETCLKERIASPFKKNSSIEFSSRVPTMTSRESISSSSKIKYFRRNYHDGLLKPFLDRHPHLQNCITWFLDCQVERVIIDEETKTATGVLVLVDSSRKKEDKVITIKASQDVIICAGAIESPALLLTSGIQGQGIGQHLKDQLLISRTYWTSFRSSSSAVSRNGISALGHYINDRQGDIYQVAIVDSSNGLDNIVPSTVAMILRRRVEVPLLCNFLNVCIYSFFQIVKTFLKCLMLYSPVGYILRHFTTTTLLCLMHPKSEGFVQIRPKHNVNASKNNKLRRSRVDLVIRVGYLNDKQDIDTLKGGWDACTEATSKSSAVEIFPCGRTLQSIMSLFGLETNWFTCYLMNFSQPYYHYCGTCIMHSPSNNDWVVDEDLNVRHYKKLRVCDASTFPSTLSSPPALSCAALGYGLSQKLVSSPSSSRERNARQIPTSL
jgi:choline dehydrogenase-like flavoprotein